MENTRHFYIDGQWVKPAVPRDYQVINPSTETPCATISLGGQADTDAAVAAAKRAFPFWSTTSPQYRADIVAQIKERYQAYADDIALAISQEMGAPIDLAREQQAACVITHIESFLKAFETFEWQRPFDPQSQRNHNALIWQPIGVVGLITPWNWPMSQVALKVISALLAGCTCVLKPSEEAPLSALLFAQLLDETDLPAGVFNLVNGDGPGVGTQLSRHADVAMISFTGSTAAGKAITIAGAETLKRVTLELGGKGANLVFADAPKGTVAQSVRRMMINSGQNCNAPSRMLVERRVYEAAIDEATTQVNMLHVNQPSEAGNHIGPVVNKRQWERIQTYIHGAISEGARLIAGGPGLPDGFNRGYYVRPTIFADVTPDMTIAQEEVFGPVMCMAPFDTEAEAITVANNTPYGLTNYAHTSDPHRANRLAIALQSGMVELNGQPRDAGMPFGGIKNSGQAREGGLWGIEEFLYLKTVSGYHF